MIYIMAALEIEVKPLLSKCRKNGLEYELMGTTVRLVISGVGMQNARKTAEWVGDRNPEFVLNVGFAGGLSPVLGRNDLFIPEIVRDRNGKTFKCAHLSPTKPLTLLTSNHVVQTGEEKKTLSALADAVDMESFAIAEVMQERGIPFSVLRVISDTAHETLPVDFTRMLDGGRPNFWSAVALLVSNPHKIPALINLGIQSKSAARKLSSSVFSAVFELERRAHTF